MHALTFGKNCGIMASLSAAAGVACAFDGCRAEVGLEQRATMSLALPTVKVSPEIATESRRARPACLARE
jgi:hypothetical protein